MKTLHVWVFAGSLAVLAAGQPVPAAAPVAQVKRSAADLEELAAPIALHPDPLIATLLTAAVYPLEIVQAARFVADTNNLAKLDEQPWDENVKAVARVPGVIKMLNDDLAWTMVLGEAFLAQDKDLLDAVQSLRAKARQMGTLKTTPQQLVTVTNVVVEKTVEQKLVVVTNSVIQVQPANPQVVYVPTYSPAVVYYPPPPAYVGPPPVVSFAAGVAVGAIIANNCDWHYGGVYHGDVDIDIDRTVNVDREVNRNTNVNTSRSASATATGRVRQPRAAGRNGNRTRAGWPEAAPLPRRPRSATAGRGVGARAGPAPPLRKRAPVLPPAEPKQGHPPARLQRPAPRPRQPRLAALLRREARLAARAMEPRRALPANVAPPVASAAAHVAVADLVESPGAIPADMKTLFRTPAMTFSNPFVPSSASRWVLSLVFFATSAIVAADRGRTFASPEEAVMTLVDATSANDTNALRVLFGPAAMELQNADHVQATNELMEFTAAIRHNRQIVRLSDSECVLYVGETYWPFPIPIVQQAGGWAFDVKAGKDELLSRRIGENELSTLETVRAYVEAQREYAAKDRDGDEVLEYAQRFESTPATKDGLYWPPDLDGEIGPLGPRVARAYAQGYSRSAVPSAGAQVEPFHGYFFKILTRQGKSAPGGKYGYTVNGNMIGGFALVAWPAEYGNTGIMTIIVNQQGRVYQKDLEPATAKTAAAMKFYDPDQTWTISPN